MIEGESHKTANQEVPQTENIKLTPPLNNPEKIAPKGQVNTKKEMASSEMETNIESNDAVVKIKTEELANNKPTDPVAPAKPDVKKEIVEKKVPAPKKKVVKEVVQKVNTTPIKKKESIPDRKDKLFKPIMSFEKTLHNFGEIVTGDVFQTKINFVNTGNAPLEIMNATATCGCTHPTFPFLPIEPGDRGYIGIEYNSKGKLGPQNPTIKVFTNIQSEPLLLKLKGTVLDKPREMLPDTTKG